MSKSKPDDKPGEIAVEEVINREIDSMLNRLRKLEVCPCCAAQGLMYRGAFLHAEVAGAEDTITLCLDVADLVEHPDDADESHTQH